MTTEITYTQLSLIEDLARLALADTGDDEAWNGMAISWSKP